MLAEDRVGQVVGVAYEQKVAWYGLLGKEADDTLPRCPA